MAEINLGGKRRELKFNFKSMVALEKQYNKPIAKIFNEEMQSESLGNMVTMIWSALIHEDKKLTTNRVENMISDSIDNGELGMDDLGDAIKETMDDSLITGGGKTDEEAEEASEDDVKN